MSAPVDRMVNDPHADVPPVTRHAGIVPVPCTDPTFETLQADVRTCAAAGGTATAPRKRMAQAALTSARGTRTVIPLTDHNLPIAKGSNQPANLADFRAYPTTVDCGARDKMRGRLAPMTKRIEARFDRRAGVLPRRSRRTRNFALKQSRLLVAGT